MGLLIGIAMGVQDIRASIGISHVDTCLKSP